MNAREALHAAAGIFGQHNLFSIGTEADRLATLERLYYWWNYIAIPVLWPDKFTPASEIGSPIIQQKVDEILDHAARLQPPTVEPHPESIAASALAAAVMDAMHTHGRPINYEGEIQPLFQLQGNLGHAQKGIQRTWQLAALAGHALQEELQAKSHMPLPLGMDFDLLQAADHMGAAIIKRGNDWTYRELTFLASEAIDEQIHARAEEISTVLLPQFFDHIESLIDGSEQPPEGGN